MRLRRLSQPFAIVALLLLFPVLVGLAQDDPRRPSSRERMSSFSSSSRTRDVFELIRGNTPAERLANLESMPGALRPSFELQKTGRGDVQVIVSEKGELEAAEQVAIICKVRARGQDRASAGTIAWLVEDGTLVKKGELLAKIDDAALRDSLKVQQIILTEKLSQLEAAKRTLERETKDLQSQIKLAEAEAKIAEAAQKAQAESADVEAKKAELKVRLARATLALVKLKANGPGGTLETEIAQLNAEHAELEAKQTPGQSAVQKLMYEAQTLRAKDAVALAQRRLEDGIAAVRARIAAAEAAVALENSRLAELQEDLGHCSLMSPCDGLVLLAEPGRPQVVAVGEPIREGQRLLTVSKAGDMQVRLKVAEAYVDRLQRGQRVLVSVAGIQQVLAAKVQNIAAVPSAADWRTSGVRLYPVTVLITEPSAMLKPMMTAQATILIDEQKNVLRVPTGAVSHRDGSSYCYVKKDDGLHERKVTLGLSGTSHVEIKTGVDADEEVVVSVSRVNPQGFPGGFNR